MHVFVVDRDPNLRADWTNALQEAGHQVTAQTGEDGVGINSFAEPFDVAFIELGLHAGNGLSLAALVAFHSKNCRILMMTEGRLFAHGELFSLAPQVSLVLRKPIPVEEMVAVAEYYGQHEPPAEDLTRGYKKGGDTREEEGAAA